MRHKKERKKKLNLDNQLFDALTLIWTNQFLSFHVVFDFLSTFSQVLSASQNTPKEMISKEKKRKNRMKDTRD